MSARLPALKPCDVIRTSGSHQLLEHPERQGLHVVVPYHTRDLKRGTLYGIVKQAGFTTEEFLRLL